MIRCKQLCPRCFLFWKNDEFILYASRVDCVCVKYDIIDYATGFGMYSDKKPSPFLLPLGMFSSMLGMIGPRVCTELYYCYYFCFIYRIRFRSLSSRRRPSCLYGSRDETRFSASDLSSGRKYR